MTNRQALIEADWLAEHLGNADNALLDCRWFLPNTGIKGRDEYDKGHIPGAVFFDIDEIKDHSSTLPHMLPSADEFATAVANMGVSNDHHVITYDSGSGMAAARVWWMFRCFGHDNVSVLDGGTMAWKNAGNAVTDASTNRVTSDFSAKFDGRLVRSLENIRKNISRGDEQVLDARSAGRFHGTAPEPRPELRSGHIPGSLSLPFDLLINDDGKMRSTEEIRGALNDSGADFGRPMTASCGSGVTACVTALAAFLAGKEDVAVYDGSWTEWGGRADTPITKEDDNG